MRKPVRRNIHFGSGQEGQKLVEALDEMAQDLGLNRSEFIQMIASSELEVKMRKVTVNVAQTDEFRCPHCGENYIDRHLHEDAGKTFVAVCDGHEGCGKKFKVQVTGS